MLIVGISGSPRKNQNSEQIISKTLDYFAAKKYETKSINLSSTKINPCLHCDYCKKNSSCTQKDAGNETNEILSKASALIIASPVYFGSMTGQLKTLLDRTLPLRRHNFLLKGKIGAAITVGGSRNGGQETTLQALHAWMLIHGMIIVGDNNHFGGTVQAPLENDNFGLETIEGTVKALENLLNKFKN